MQTIQNSGWTMGQLKKYVGISFLLISVLFTYLYVAKTNPVGFVNNNLPFSLNSEQPRFLFAIYGSGMNGGFSKPMEVTVAGNRIYVTDTGNKRVQVFDREGNSVSQFGKAGSKAGEFSFPYGIAVDGAGLVYVSDMTNGNISVFDGKGNFVKTLADKKKINRPGGMYLAGNKLYVADIGDSKVKVFDLKGSKLLEFGKLGKGKGELNSPNSVTVDGNRVYVADSGNDRVQIFDTDGKYLSVIEKDNKTAMFVNPRGVGVSGGKVFVASKVTNYVVALDKDGKKLFTWGGMGQEDVKFALPNGLFVDDDGRIYIADSVNQRVVVYQN
ncbi:MAG: 6-bladed beta-propeller [Thermincolia bacterium]